jgi:hypothetical protein
MKTCSILGPHGDDYAEYSIVGCNALYLEITFTSWFFVWLVYALIKMDLREIGWDGMDWIDLAQDRDQWRVLVNMVMNLRVPENAGKFLNSCTIGSFSRWVQLHE